MKIKHFVTTRFLCKQIGTNNVNLFDEKLICSRLQHLKSNVCNTLSNQTNLDFEWIIMIHPEWNDAIVNHIYEEIMSESPKMTVKLIPYGDLVDEYINSFWKDNDVVAITRIDDDDFVNKRAIQQVYDIAVENYPFEILSCGYKSGYKYNSSDNLIQKHGGAYPTGYMSIFASILFNTHIVPYVTNLNPNSINHTKIVSKLDDSVYSTKHICIDDANAYVYFRHNDAISINANGKIKNIIEMTPEFMGFLTDEFGMRFKND